MPIVAQISAANKLRNQVLAVPGTILIGQAGHPDKIIRFEHVPDYLNEFKKKNASYIFINMDKGPDQEAWSNAMRETFSTARRDRPVPNPIPVAPDSHEEWSVSLEDVPLIENGVAEVTVQEVKNEGPQVVNPIFACPVCNLTYNSEHAMKIHKGRAHK